MNTSNHDETTYLADLQKRAEHAKALGVDLYLSIDDVARLLCVSSLTVRRMVDAGRFPGPIRATENRTVWILDDVRHYQDQRRRERAGVGRNGTEEQTSNDPLPVGGRD